eukprot:14521674-Ditylum_brightwellii.AAC.1
MAANRNIHAVGTCKANRKGFDSDALKLDDPGRDEYVCLVDNMLGMHHDDPWYFKYQLPSGPRSHHYILSKCNSTLPGAHGGVDKSDQYCVTGSGLHNTFLAWNLSVNKMQEECRGGHMFRWNVLKWEIYAAIAEEMMTYADE